MVMVDRISMNRLVLGRLMFQPLDRQAVQNQIRRAAKDNNVYNEQTN